MVTEIKTVTPSGGLGFWGDVNILYLKSGDTSFRYPSREPSVGSIVKW